MSASAAPYENIAGAAEMHVRPVQAAPGSATSRWQTVVLHEWRNCADEDYTYRLFFLVSEEPIEQPAARLFILFHAIGGLLLGWLVSLLIGNYSLPAKEWHLIGPWYIPLLGLLIGGALAAFYCLSGRWQPSWQTILERVTPPETPQQMLTYLLGGALVGFVLTWVLMLIIAAFHYLTGLMGPKHSAPGTDAFSSAKAKSSMIGIGWIGGLVYVMYSENIAVGLGLALGATVASALYTSLGFGISVGLALFFGVLLAAQRLPSPYLHDYRRWWYWWPERPNPFELEKALGEAAKEDNEVATKWRSYLAQLEERRRQPVAINTLVKGLTSADWSERFYARHVLLYRGGEAVPALLEHAASPDLDIRNTSVWLLEGIAAETTARLASRAGRLICPKCLVACHANTIKLPHHHTLTYYGCRSCGQSRRFDQRPREIIAVLDNAMAAPNMLRDGVLWENWLRRRALFDFGRVAIVRATDEQVMQFVEQVRTDTDSVRKAKYKMTPCLIAPTSQLTQPTLRALHDLFGKVEIRTGKLKEGEQH